MSYSEIYLPQKTKIPTLALLLFIILIFVIFARVFSKSSIPSKASKIELKRIEITNLTPNQVTIFWQTDQKETGWLIYGQKGKGIDTLAFDDRDIPTNKTAHSYHVVTLSNLLPNVIYQFKLIAHDEIINSSSVFTFATPKDFRIKSNMKPAYGKIIKPNNQPQDNAIIILQIENSLPLTTITKPTGEWLIPLFAVYQKNTLQQMVITPDNKLSIQIVTDDSQTTQINTNVQHVSPLPQTVVIGSNYTFTGQDAVLGAQDTRANNSPAEIKGITIDYPKENALIPGFKPLIKGQASAGSDILVTIQGNDRTYATKTKTDSNGIWQVNMSDKMLIGKYTMTAEATSQDQSTSKAAVTFLIVANEGNDAKVLGVASAAPTITKVSPTNVIAPTATTIASSSARPTSPVTGSSNIVPIVGGFSLVIVGLGILLAF